MIQSCLAQLHGREPVLEARLGMHHVLVHLAQAGAQRARVGRLQPSGMSPPYELRALGRQLTGEVGVEGRRRTPRSPGSRRSARVLRSSCTSGSCSGPARWGIYDCSTSRGGQGGVRW